MAEQAKHSAAQPGPARPSTAQHSTAQHSTAQNSAAPLTRLFVLDDLRGPAVVGGEGGQAASHGLNHRQPKGCREGAGSQMHRQRQEDE